MHIDKYNWSAITPFEFNTSQYTTDEVVNTYLTSHENLEDPSDFGVYVLIAIWSFLFWLFTSKYFGFKLGTNRAGLWASSITLSVGIIAFLLPVGYVRSYRPLLVLGFVWFGFLIANRQEKVTEE